jgi:diketogulonate reductase-like aldo/keto reductase
MTVNLIGPAGIPSLGLGTFKVKGRDARDIVAAALAAGYRHIDTAQAYKNETEVGQGLRDARVPRDQVFLTTKILPKDFAARDLRIATERSLRDLAADYVDLLLLHWPSRDVPLAETLQAFDCLREEGKTRYLGVSNFTIAQVDEVRTTLPAPLAANQIEFHPFIDQTKLGGYLADRGIPFEAYSPLAQGKIFDNEVLKEIASDHGVGEAEIALAWILSKPNAIAIPKTQNPERLASNLAATDISLSPEEVRRIDGLARTGGRLVSPEELAPDWD